jgi:hypothetical protein
MEGSPDDAIDIVVGTIHGEQAGSVHRHDRFGNQADVPALQGL